jgi:hypothetical protein
MATDELKVSKRQLRDACHAWDSGGTLALGLWLSKHKPHFTVRDYSDLIELVRTELNDAVDYSVNEPRRTHRPKGGGKD